MQWFLDPNDEPKSEQPRVEVRAVISWEEERVARFDVNSRFVGNFVDELDKIVNDIRTRAKSHLKWNDGAYEVELVKTLGQSLKVLSVSAMVPADVEGLYLASKLFDGLNKLTSEFPDHFWSYEVGLNVAMTQVSYGLSAQLGGNRARAILDLSESAGGSPKAG